MFIQDSCSSQMEHQEHFIFLMNFIYVMHELPKLNLRSQLTPKSRNHSWVRHSPETWERNTAQPKYVHDCDIAWAIVIAYIDCLQRD